MLNNGPPMVATKRSTCLYSCELFKYGRSTLERLCCFPAPVLRTFRRVRQPS